MQMHRRVEPEILDQLPADDPEAIRSRRDLRWINGMMGNHRWLARRIRAHYRPGWRVVELGAGDGGFGERLVARNVIPAGNLRAVDLAPRPASWPAAAAWVQGDMFAEPLPDAEIVVANLFLHHFEDPALKEVGKMLPGSCRVLLCCEPARRRLHLWQGALLSFFTLGKVTKHDMPVSIRAGFLGAELPRFLGLPGWTMNVSTTFFGAYRLEATQH